MLQPVSPQILVGHSETSPNGSANPWGGLRHGGGGRSWGSEQTLPNSQKGPNCLTFPLHFEFPSGSQIRVTGGGVTGTTPPLGHQGQENNLQDNSFPSSGR